MLPGYAPSVDDLLADSLVQQVMRADRVDPQTLRILLNGVAVRIADRRRAGCISVGADLGRRSALRASTLPTRALARPAEKANWAGLCG